jgi:predicted nucleic acid-binding protein
MNRSSAICIDANLVIQLVANPANLPVGRQWAAWLGAGQAFVAPTLLAYEVTNGVYRLGKHGVISAPRARAALEAALELPIELYDGGPLHLRAADLATRFQLSAAYDAHYLALSERLGVPFHTADERLWRRVHSELPWIHLVK